MTDEIVQKTVTEKAGGDLPGKTAQENAGENAQQKGGGLAGVVLPLAQGARLGARRDAAIRAQMRDIHTDQDQQPHELVGCIPTMALVQHDLSMLGLVAVSMPNQSASIPALFVTKPGS